MTITTEVERQTSVRAAIFHCRPWGDRALTLARALYPSVEWQIASAPTAWSPADLDFAFFLHWGARVDVPTDRPVCVGFHLGRLPEERGGSPLQHRILAGQTWAELTAFRMTNEIDVGPIYGRASVSIDSGSAEKCYMLADTVAVSMFGPILGGVEPVPQKPADGLPFRRRQPHESELPADLDLRRLYDFVRMLDAPEYPAAFIRLGGLRIEFRGADRYADRVEMRAVAREEP